MWFWLKSVLVAEKVAGDVANFTDIVVGPFFFEDERFSSKKEVFTSTLSAFRFDEVLFQLYFPKP